MSSIVALGDVAKFIRGITFKPDDVIPVDDDDAVACMRTKNVQAEIDLNDVWGIPRRFVKREDQFLKLGDLLVSTANSWNLVGKCSWVPELPWPSTLGGFISALRPNPKRVHPRYLFWWFGYDQTQEVVRSFGRRTTSISNLSLEQCLAMEMPLPAIAEQRRIAGILDKADALRTQRRAALADLDTLTQSTFLDLFGDPATNPRQYTECKLGDIAEQVTDGEHLTPVRAEEGVKLLSARNVRDGYLDFSDVDFIGQAEHERIRRRCNPVFGDVLISCSGSIGRVARVETAEQFSLVRSVALVRTRESVVRSKYLEHYLRTPALKARMLRRANASSQANLFQGQIRELPVLLAPIDLQDTLARRITAIEALKSRHRAALAELDTLFASLQHRAFRGEL